jgi:hypothetical protein
MRSRVDEQTARHCLVASVLRFTDSAGSNCDNSEVDAWIAIVAAMSGISPSSRMEKERNV